MSDTPTAAAGRNWRPQTKDDARALALYDDAIISGIADVLPGFTEGADQDVLAGLIRQWASQQIAFRRGASQDAPSQIRDELETVGAKMREAAQALDQLPDIAKGRMATLRHGGDSDWVGNLTYICSAPGLLEELAGLAEQAAETVKVRRGRLQGGELRWAIEGLCWVYETVTDKPPGRLFDPYGERDGGPFEAFVAAAIKPLWPKAGGAGKTIRAALSWYRNRPPAA